MSYCRIHPRAEARGIEYEQSDPDSADHVTATQDGDWLAVL